MLHFATVPTFENREWCDQIQILATVLKKKTCTFTYHHINHIYIYINNSFATDPTAEISSFSGFWRFSVSSQLRQISVRCFPGELSVGTSRPRSSSGQKCPAPAAGGWAPRWCHPAVPRDSPIPARCWLDVVENQNWDPLMLGNHQL